MPKFPSSLVALAMHSFTLIIAMVCATVLAWHGSVSGETAIVVIVAVTGINGTGTVAIAHPGTSKAGIDQ